MHVRDKPHERATSFHCEPWSHLETCHQYATPLAFLPIVPLIRPLQSTKAYDLPRTSDFIRAAESLKQFIAVCQSGDTRANTSYIGALEVAKRRSESRHLPGLKTLLPSI